MTLAVRKSIVISAIGVLLALAHVAALAGWLEEVGVTAWAQHVCEEYVTGTAITVILALLVLLVPPGVGLAVRRCRVCEAILFRRGRYCSGCGSRVHR